MYERPQPEWYVLTKFAPPMVRAHTVHRPHLDQMLRHSVSAYSLTLLSAPAGYGKTTLLSSLPVLLPDYPLAWISLDEEDNDPVRFIGLLAAALGKIHPRCGQSVLSHLRGGISNRADLRKISAALINDVLKYISEPFALVLDDLHFVTEPLVYNVLDHLLEQSPPNLHLAIGTRTDPPLRLGRLAARGQLGEFRRGDLSLNLEQTRQLMNQILDLDLSLAETRTLYEQTEGWPGILCLLAGPLARLEGSPQRSQFLASLGHREQRVHDFLSEEILFGLPEDQRLFLLQTSILSEITPSICRALTGREDSDAVLWELYRRNLAVSAISVDAGGEPVYRYNTLLVKMLRERLNWEQPTEAAELHRRAAEVQRTPGRAIAHYLQAGLWDQAAQLMITYGMELLYQGMAETLQKWYVQLPDNVRASYPRLSLIVARTEIHRGNYQTAKELLEEAALHVASEADEVDVLTSQITLAYNAGDRERVERYVKRGLELPLNPVARVSVGIAGAWLDLKEARWDAVCEGMRASLGIPAAANDRRADLIGVTYTNAFLAVLPGCMQAVDAYCAEVLAAADPDSAWYLGAQELSSWILLWRGQLDEAQKRIEAAEAARQRLGGYPFVGNDLPILLGILALARADRGLSEASLDLLQERIERPGRHKVMLHYHAAGRMMAYLDRREEAMLMADRLESLDLSCKVTCYLACHLRGLIAAIYDDHDEAAAALSRAMELEALLPIAHVGGSAHLIWASILLGQGRVDEALEAAKPVLKQWHQDSLPGFAAVDGPILWPLLELASSLAVPGAKSMRKLFTEGNSWPTEHSRETLSPREQDVLRLLMEGCTNLQIGYTLHISPETVKTHVSRIFRKLNVNSRTQAAVRARELGF